MKYRIFQTLSALSICLALALSKAQAQHDEEDHDAHGHDAEAHDAAGEAGHDEHEEDALSLTPEQLKRFGISIAVAGPGSLQGEVSLPGEVVFNEDSVVHMVPRVSGIARSVLKGVGDAVKTGDILAVIDSRELADAKAEYLAALARKNLAEKTFTREKQLREKDISSEQDFLEAEQAFAEARISLLSAGQKLSTLGLEEKEIEALADTPGTAITRYEIRSPIDGVVTARHLSRGEHVGPDTAIFTVADLSSVWINLAVYTKHIPAVEKGQKISVRVDATGMEAEGVISMVTPFVDDATRAATARVVLDNKDGKLYPGTFVTGFASASQKEFDIVISKQAVQTLEGRTVVFIEHEGGFEPVPVVTGRSDRHNIEIKEGLEKDTHYVAEGAFELKATILTRSLDSHAGHGH